MADVPQVHGAGHTIDEVQAGTRAGFDKLPQFILDGHMLKDVDLVPGSKEIEHGLKREMQGWMMLCPRGLTSSYFVPVETSRTVTHFTVYSVAALRVDFWVW